MNYYPLFRVRSWNNGVRCMSFYIVIAINFCYDYKQNMNYLASYLAVNEFETGNSDFQRDKLDKGYFSISHEARPSGQPVAA